MDSRACAFLKSVAMTSLLLLAHAVSAQEGGETFYGDILPVFQKHCIECHRVNGSAPQSLETYDLARSWIRTSRRTMREGSMPPWYADPEVGEWRNANLPTQAEIDLVSDWVKSGAEPGDESLAPPPLEFSAEWKLGQPDVRLDAPESVEVPPSQPDLIRNFVLDPGFGEDTWLSAIEVKPTALKVVRELRVSAVPAAVADSLDPAEFDLHRLEGKHDLALWTRGMSLIEGCPEGSGILIPAGWKLILQAHYRSGDEGGTDRPALGLHRAASTPSAEYVSVTIANRDLVLPPDSYDFEVNASAKLEGGIRVESILPEMHYLGLSLEAEAVLPDGSKISLIKIRNYDYRLPTLYSAAKPIDLPAGTQVNVKAYYENSPDNPHNPNTVVEEVRYGAPPKGEALNLILRGARL